MSTTPREPAARPRPTTLPAPAALPGPATRPEDVPAVFAARFNSGDPAALAGLYEEGAVLAAGPDGDPLAPRCTPPTRGSRRSASRSRSVRAGCTPPATWRCSSSTG